MRPVDAPIVETSREFRYVFYAPPDRYEETVSFYGDVLLFPVIGGFDYGVFFQAGAGVIEVIRDPRESLLRSYIFQDETYVPPAGGFLVMEVSDVDELYARLSGLQTFVHPPMNWEWGVRDFKLKDPCGNILCFFSQVPS